MKLFSSESIFNAKTGKWEERYWIKGSPVDGDLYFFEMDREKYLEIEKLEKQEDEIENECDCPCETNSFLVAVTDLVNDTLEMFEDQNTCDDCKFQALMDLVIMGVDGALQGYIVREEDLN